MNPQTLHQGYFPWSKVSTHPQTAAEAVGFFQTNGYVILTSFASPTETGRLRQRAAEIIADFLKSPKEASVFTTSEQTRKLDDNYFFRSSSNVSCFLEDNNEEVAVNKIGHAMHDLDDVFKSFSRAEKVRQVGSLVGYEKAMLVQSMYIVKGARVGGMVDVHRDETFVMGQEGGCLGMWWALEEATVRNGCLWAVRGSHVDGRGRLRYVRDGKGAMTFEGEDNGGYTDGDFVALEMAEGDLVVLHGAVVHKSEKNESEKSRHAYSIHLVKGGLEKECWLRRDDEFPFQEL